MIDTKILHYRIIKKLGEGGMGIVYLAEDTKLERKVAIKFLPHHISANSEERERFKIEAKAAASLSHPNIATIHAIEETENEMFIVMEYIEGKELKEIISPLSQRGDKGGFPINDVINYATQIAEGLEAAHKKGIIHRDIKSQNIMITNDGKVKIMDFGLAKIKGGSELTKIGTTIGTTAYMSPEQARGEKVDQRTDIWSFGVVLYEMLTGELPFKGDYDQAIIYSILNEEPNYSVDLDQSLKEILKKAFEKNIIDRYADLKQIIKALKNIKVPRKNVMEDHSPSIAVLPFSDLSPSHDQEYFCEGIAEEILNSVSKINGLRVSSRTSSFQFKEKKYDIREIGHKLRVDSILERKFKKSRRKNSHKCSANKC